MKTVHTMIYDVEKDILHFLYDSIGKRDLLILFHKLFTDFRTCTSYCKYGTQYIFNIQYKHTDVSL